MNTQIAGLVFGAIFVLTGVLGFVPNPLVSANGLFAVNTAHNMVHVITGGVFLLGAVRCADKTDVVFKSVGSAYVLVTVLGFLAKGNMLLGIVHINQADRCLHLGLAIVILATGLVLPNRRATVTT
jgi:hypothetical protein